MGAKNPDRIPVAARFGKCRTVADMLSQRWDVISKCQTCDLTMQADLALIARISGPATMLWNRKARCRRLHCAGVVEFMARAPGMAWHEYLRFDAREPDPVPPWLRHQRKAADEA